MDVCLNNHFSHVKIWNHPTETTIYKQMFQVPGVYSIHIIENEWFDFWDILMLKSLRLVPYSWTFFVKCLPNLKNSNYPCKILKSKFVNLEIPLFQNTSCLSNWKKFTNTAPAVVVHLPHEWSRPLPHHHERHRPRHTLKAPSPGRRSDAASGEVVKTKISMRLEVIHSSIWNPKNLQNRKCRIRTRYSVSFFSMSEIQKCTHFDLKRYVYSKLLVSTSNFSKKLSAANSSF